MDSTIFEVCSNDTKKMSCVSAQARRVKEVLADPTVNTSEGVINHMLIAITKASLDEAVSRVLETL